MNYPDPVVTSHERRGFSVVHARRRSPVGSSDFTVSGLCAHTSAYLGGHRADLGHECSTVADVVTACLSGLPAVDGAAVAMMTGPAARQTIYASDGVIAAVEDVQFLHGQGPCWEVFATGCAVMVADLHLVKHRVRWPAYLPAIAALGVSASFAFPVGVGSFPLGVLDLYRGSPGALTAEQVSTARGYAAAAGFALLNSQALAIAEPGEVPGGAHRDQVHQAVGMVLVQLNSGSQEALLRLQAYAYATSSGLDEVCHDVVTRRLTFTADAAPGT